MVFTPIRQITGEQHLSLRGIKRFPGLVYLMAIMDYCIPAPVSWTDTRTFDRQKSHNTGRGVSHPAQKGEFDDMFRTQDTSGSACGGSGGVMSGIEQIPAEMRWMIAMRAASNLPFAYSMAMKTLLARCTNSNCKLR